MKMLISSLAAFICLCSQTVTAVDVDNGERVGGCPSPSEVSNMHPAFPSMDECNVDTDCSGNANYKCCPYDTSSFHVCVKPLPACRDGTKIYSGDLFEGKCGDQSWNCIDRGCENGPEGEGGWGSACCGGYTFLWLGTPRPTCENNVEPLKDSEGEYFWCGPSSYRTCPNNSGCTRDAGGYEICCPAPGVSEDRCELPLESGPCEADISSWGFNPETNRCEHFSYGGCQGNENRFATEEECYIGCYKGGCLCAQGIPVCAEGSVLQNKQLPGACCPDYECVPISVCPAGEFVPMESNPCMNCRCGNDGEVTDDCEEIMCDIIVCPDGQWAKHIPGTCCGFECVPAKNQVCPAGELVPMEDNPCMSCRCGNDGQLTDDCREIMCSIIACPDGKWAKHIPGTCCGFECVPAKNKDCTCAVPSCSGSSKLKETYVPDSCCPEYECVKDNPWISDGQVTVIGIITIALAVIIIVTAISVSVFCYIHMKKHKTAGPGGNQAYNNTAYADEKKQIPFTYDNIYVAEKDSNINTAKMT